MSGRRWALAAALLLAGLGIALLVGDASEPGAPPQDAPSAARDAGASVAPPPVAVGGAAPGLAPGAPPSPSPAGDEAEGDASPRRVAVVVGPGGERVTDARVQLRTGFLLMTGDGPPHGRIDLSPDAEGRYAFSEADARSRTLHAWVDDDRFLPTSVAGDALPPGEVVLRLGEAWPLHVRVVSEDGELGGGTTVGWRTTQPDAARHPTRVPPGPGADLVLRVGHDGPVLVQVEDVERYAEPSEARVDRSSAPVVFRLRRWSPLALRLRDEATGLPVRARALTSIGRETAPGQWAYQTWEREWPAGDGLLAARPLREGRHVVHLQVEGYEAWKDEDVLVERGAGARTLDVRLRRSRDAGAIDVLVRSAPPPPPPADLPTPPRAGRPVRRDWLVLARGTATEGAWRSHPSLDADGRVRVEGLAPGDWDVMVWSPQGHVGAAWGVRVLGGTVVEASVDLVRGLVVALSEERSLDSDVRRALGAPDAAVVSVGASGAPGPLPLIRFADGGWTVEDASIAASHALGPYPFDRVVVAWKAPPDRTGSATVGR